MSEYSKYYPYIILAVVCLVIGAVATNIPSYFAEPTGGSVDEIVLLEERLSELEKEVNSLRTRVRTEVDLLHEEMDLAQGSLTADITSIQNEVNLIPAGFPPPDYDSGWKELSFGPNNFLHDLSTNSIFVYMIGRSHNGIEYMVTQIGYGGDYYSDRLDFHRRGVSWYLSPVEDTLNLITIYRYEDDLNNEETRILIWKLPTPPS